MNIKKFYEDTNSNYNAALSIMMNDMLIERMIKSSWKITHITPLLMPITLKI